MDRSPTAFNTALLSDCSLQTNSIASTLYILQRCIAFAVLLMLAIIPLPLQAEDAGVPLDLQIKLLLTALTYDRNLPTNADDIFTIGILYFPDTTGSQEQASDFEKTLIRFKEKKIKSLNINKILLKHTDDAELTKNIAEHKIRVLYIAPGRGEKLKKVLEVTRSQKVLSCTSDIMIFQEYEVSLGVGLLDNKPKIYLNNRAAKDEGADFSAKFLRVVQLYDPGYVK